MLDNKLLTLDQLVSRLAVQWEPGSMIPHASFNVNFSHIIFHIEKRGLKGHYLGHRT